MSQIWLQCKGQNQLTLFEKQAWRIDQTTENFEKDLVDSADEWMLLQELLKLKSKTQDPIFLDPPFEYASRFGTRLDSSVWYGSLEIKTGLAEKAFYLFNFLRAGGITKNIPYYFEGFFQKIKTKKGIDLSKSPFLRYRHLISSPNEYKESQSLGLAMRENGIEAFCYYSARSSNDEINLGVFVSEAFEKHSNKNLQIWRGVANQSSIEFTHLSSREKQKMNFSITQFLINKQLPFPAN